MSLIIAFSHVMMLKFSKYAFLVVIQMNICKCTISSCFILTCLQLKLPAVANYYLKVHSAPPFFTKHQTLLQLCCYMCVLGNGNVGSEGRCGLEFVFLCGLLQLKIKTIKIWL